MGDHQLYSMRDVAECLEAGYRNAAKILCSGVGVALGRPNLSFAHLCHDADLEIVDQLHVAAQTVADLIAAAVAAGQSWCDPAPGADHVSPKSILGDERETPKDQPADQEGQGRTYRNMIRRSADYLAGKLREVMARQGYKWLICPACSSALVADWLYESGDKCPACESSELQPVTAENDGVLDDELVCPACLHTMIATWDVGPNSTCPKCREGRMVYDVPF